MRNIGLFLMMVLMTITLQSAGLRILYIGDSITDGNWGGGGTRSSSDRNQWDMNHIFGSGFMYLCAAHYTGNYPGYEYLFFNRGISGNTLYDLEKRWKTDVLDMKPDVLSVLVGTNDICYYLQGDKAVPFDFSTWEATYRKLLDDVRRMNPGIRIVLAGPFVARTGKMRENPDFRLYNEMTRRCGKIVEKIAMDYQAVFLPYQEMFDTILETKPTSQDTYWIWDGIHPTPAGHMKMADLWIRHADHKKILLP